MTCRERCMRYLERHANEWVCGGTMQRLAVQHSTYTPQNVGRRLRELAEEGRIEVKQEKGLAWYRYSPLVLAENERRRIEGLKAFDALPVK